METNKVNEMLQSENTSISNRNFDLQAYCKSIDLETQFEQLRNEYNHLLNTHLTLKKNFGFSDVGINEFKYKTVHRSGLLQQPQL